MGDHTLELQVRKLVETTNNLHATYKKTFEKRLKAIEGRLTHLEPDYTFENVNFTEELKKLKSNSESGFAEAMNRNDQRIYIKVLSWTEKTIEIDGFKNLYIEFGKRFYKKLPEDTKLAIDIKNSTNIELEGGNIFFSAFDDQPNNKNKVIAIDNSDSIVIARNMNIYGEVDSSIENGHFMDACEGGAVGFAFMSNPF